MKIIIADDHPLFREALAARVARVFAGAEIIEVASLDEALAAAEQAPDVPRMFLLDYRMPGVSAEALRRLVLTHQDSRVAVISGSVEAEHVREVVQAGVHGFIPKTAKADCLQHALQMLAAGGTSVPAEYILSGPPQAPDPAIAGAEWMAELSEREATVMRGLACGQSNKAIARELGLAEATVKLHVSNIFRKTGARTRSEAAVLAARARLD